MKRSIGYGREHQITKVVTEIFDTAKDLDAGV
jgi:hypothetical protein